MQNYTPPDGWGPVLHYLQENCLSLQAALIAFFIAIAFSLWMVLRGEGHSTLASSIFLWR